MTVSFNGLGNEGRLGNQMFQYAFIRGMSKKYGYDFIIQDIRTYQIPFSTDAEIVL